MRAAQALAKVLADVERHRHLFDLDRDNLGHELCKAATDGVMETIKSQADPDGAPWPRLTFGYEDWKSKEYPGRPMAVLEGLMASPEQVAGEIEVTREKATVTYGISEEARQEAEWFQEGKKSEMSDKHSQEPRRFWGFTGASLKEVRSILDRRFSTV